VTDARRGGVCCDPVKKGEGKGTPREREKKRKKHDATGIKITKKGQSLPTNSGRRKGFYQVSEREENSTKRSGLLSSPAPEERVCRDTPGVEGESWSTGRGEGGGGRGGCSGVEGGGFSPEGKRQLHA